MTGSPDSIDCNGQGRTAMRHRASRTAALGGVALLACLVGSGRFLSVAAARSPRAAQTATLLTAGRVLIAGGTSADGHPLNEAEIWDVARAAATAASGVLAQARAGHRAELLGDGRVLITGGVGSDGTSLTDAEV